LREARFDHNATLGYAGPFVLYVALMGLEHLFGLPVEWTYPVRVLVVCVAVLWVSRPYLSLRVRMPWASVALGIVVFLVWIGPDVLFGPGYRHFRLFENPLTGAVQASLKGPLRTSASFLAIRTLGSCALVPIIEELFWRGWMMRWLIDTDFLKVPLGEYVPSAFWLVAILFASEHGPYWEVGLAAGILYNWWLVRTRNLADCMLAHAVTNGLLAAYVIAQGQWQYWL
jgi:CAAX prenyl protease-like protein